MADTDFKPQAWTREDLVRMTRLQHDYGLDPASGDVTDLARLDHLDDARRETARLQIGRAHV